MRVKRYNTFLKESKNNKYSIYDWFEDLKLMEWSKKPKEDLKKWSDHFIGAGYYEKVSKKVDDIFESLKSVDIDYIDDRMFDVWDELPIEMDKNIMTGIAYGDYENYNKENDYKYNGLISAIDPYSDSRKVDITIHMLKEIIYPTMFKGSIHLRVYEDEIYVTDKRHQCMNFDIFKMMNFDTLREFPTTDTKVKLSLAKYEIDKLKLYNVDKIIDMYKPCLVIDMKGTDGRGGEVLKLSKLEPLLDDVLEMILPVIKYEDVIWPYSRGNRKFDNDDFYDYTLKILLK